jgi:hypothetical protein
MSRAMLREKHGAEMAVRAFVPPPIGDDDHIIRRLGWAVVLQWSEIPAPVKRQLREQAIAIQDENPVQLNEQISMFIQKHGNAPRPWGR